MGERHKNIKPIYDLVVKKVFRNEEVALQFVKDIFDLPAKSAKLIEGNQIFTANSNVDSDFNIASYHLFMWQLLLIKIILMAMRLLVLF